MQTECTQRAEGFQGLGRRAVVAQFDGGTITSDGGGLLLREVEQRTRIVERFAACFTDHRRPEYIEHTVAELVAQRVYGLALGYEDLNDHDQLRRDPLLAVLVDKRDPLGATRKRAADRGAALAGKSTLNRLELTRPETAAAARYQKIALDPAAVDQMLVEVFLDAHAEAPEWIILDVDATDDPVHGMQEGRFFHGYYGHYCYLPLYIFCGEHLLLARLRTADRDAAAGVVEEVERMVAQLRARWPAVKIVLRGDSGFCREQLLAWCEAQVEVFYVVGLARKARLERELAPALAQAQQECAATQSAARRFHEFAYQTRESWSRARRVIGKAEVLPGGPNPRFIVTNLPAATHPGQLLYELGYCARGDMENRIKEQQLALFADRTSTATLRANQVRLYCASVAYLVMQALRRLGLAGSALARAQCATIRTTLLKIGAQIRVTVRKVWVALSSASPYQSLFAHVLARLHTLPVLTRAP
ncbi:MAG TPA: IS1380 family transposase [Candidatus Dormibacteraeota bacterium]|nr:IS1380 family transposase [Candidatus Dormibacteraeota bacterium]